MSAKIFILCAVFGFFLVGCEAPETVPAEPAGKGRKIRIVGSSTVYPFAAKVAEEFKNKTGFNVVIESTGSGGGHKLFCAGAGDKTPDITNSSRPQKKTERDLCRKNGVEDVVEVKVGYDGIVLATALDGLEIDLSLKEIYQAFAQQVPTSDTDCTMQANPNASWSDIAPDLPDVEIKAYGPPPTSGTRDAFVETAMEAGAHGFACLADLAARDDRAFRTLAHTLREDGKWIDAGENDNSVVRTLINTPTAVAVLGYTFLDQNRNLVKAARIGGIGPEFETISEGRYPLSRSLFFYLKTQHLKTTKGLKAYGLEFTLSLIHI